MTKRTILGREVETDLPDPDQVDTNAPGPAPGGFFGDVRPAGPDEAVQDSLRRIADAMEGIRTELSELRKMIRT